MTKEATKEMKRNIAVAKGDGIGEEITESVLEILEKAEAPINFDMICLGEKLYKQGFSNGIDQKALEVIRCNKILLKGPITTPRGGGYSSINVFLRKEFGLYANIRPVFSFHPFIKTFYKKMNLVVIRENLEDLYSGIEYSPTSNIVKSLKIYSKTGIDEIVHYAFEYAKHHGRKKVTLLVKDNIMKKTDGLFLKRFNEISRFYPDIVSENYIVDIGMAKIATEPELFDVIVTSNLYGDIISDIVAKMSGSVGMCGSCNIGNQYSMFEAIHGSAPDIAGFGIANPSALLFASTMMLRHIGSFDIADNIENSLFQLLKDGYRTPDIYNQTDSNSKFKISTKEFTSEMIKNLQNINLEYKKKNNYHFNRHFDLSSNNHLALNQEINESEEKIKTLIGFDIYMDIDYERFISILPKLNWIFYNISNLTFDSISSNGISFISKKMLNMLNKKDYVQKKIDIAKKFSIYQEKIDLIKARFFPVIHVKANLLDDKSLDSISHQDIIYILTKITELNIDFTSIENIYIVN